MNIKRPERCGKWLLFRSLYFKMNKRISKQRLKELVYDSYSFVSLFREIRASSK